MKDKLTFITASAGSGKTYSLVKEVIDAVRSGFAKPGRIIATTFTCAAANEMKERISSAFHEAKLHDEASELESDGMISTVHGICFKLLNRFAFEAGISPDIRVLDETEAKLLLDRSIDEVVDEATRQEVYTLASRLGQRNSRTWQWYWRRDVKMIVENARSNDIPLARLREMGEASWQEMLEELGGESIPDLDDRLCAKIDDFLSNSEHSTLKNTRDYRLLVMGIKARVKAANFPWSNWEKLTREKPESKLKDYAEAIADVARQVQKHPRLHRDLRNYITLLFEIAEKSGTRFTELKRDRGAADFADLEKATLDLLRENGNVTEVLAEDIDLLLVDEFQDTSPIQLALFAELGKLAKRVIWVGDVKQSIYGFRGSDPELVFQAASGAGKRESLGNSWRSLPGIVGLNNLMFAPAFEEHLGLSQEETVILPKRGNPPGIQPAIEVTELSSGETYNNGRPKYLGRNRPSVIADAVTDLIKRGDQLVVDKSSLTKTDLTGKARPIEPGDIAILVRRGANAENIGAQLRARGFDVSMTGSGLLAAPEAVLAIACLRRWIDSADSLAAAEIIALESLNKVETWLEDRLTFIENLEESELRNPWEPSSSPALSSLLAAARDDEFRTLNSPLASFDRAIQAAGVTRIISAWGPGETRAGQRLANLEQLRRYIADYETRAMEFGTPATLNGLFGWLEDLTQSGEDLFPKNRTKGAISVGTYHSSKGLEWPVVFLSDLGDSPMTSLYNLRVVRKTAGDTKELDFSAPLAGRELRLWIHPFGKGFSLGGDHPLDIALEDSETGRQVAKRDENELLRLLYVGMTRARDRMIFLHEPCSVPTWLQGLGMSEAAAILNRNLNTIPTTHRIYEFNAENERLAVAKQSVIQLPKTSPVKTPRLPANLTPSGQDRIEGASIKEIIQFGSRLPLEKAVNERDYGDAMHRIFASEVFQPGLSETDRNERIKWILAAFDLDKRLNTKEILRSVDRYRKFVRDTFDPESEEVEVPFSVTNAEGQRITGFIDHLLHLKDGRKVIIDHKIYPGGHDQRREVALGYSGQLATYAGCVDQGAGASTWIHFATTGEVMNVEVPTR
ncbi:MAG: UvrD-helicase domain-containing protein [Verrucomicrobiales bacterium]|nr:UvrD-helicase domain-containing protein [Verrucomicrobiales bacterium]